ncbi:MAG: protein-glutamate O-methyltransferase family protein [Spirochaetales bacterium]|jgi:uncharacterized protein with ATP-grasp and redox domains|nr:protein-glutamate O-methyltransferase family protein [Spirochaetales bacterium]
MNEPLPAYIGMTGEKPFARYTLEYRFPGIIDIAASARPGVYSRRLEALRREAAEGRVTDPFAESGEDAPPFDKEAFHPNELAAWREEIGRYQGKLWKDTPFYFAEAYMYLKILLASGYYDSSSEYFQADPYEPTKEKELDRFLAAQGMETVFTGFTEMASAPAREENFAAALLFMLKANRIDLSNAKIAEVGRRLILSGGRDDLLVDHTGELAKLIASSRKTGIILDNAGAELAADLVFVWLYLSSHPERQVVLHAKKAPTFVSDAMIKDILSTAARLASRPHSARIGLDIQEFLAGGRLRLTDHYFWNGPKHFPEMPQEIKAELAGADVTLLKGDANFRRMIEDRSWPFSVNLEEITGWFPGSYAILRTFKSEVAADISEELCARMNEQDPGWLTDGRWGCVRLVARRG